MKNTKLFMVFTAANILMAGQLNATDITSEEVHEQRKVAQPLTTLVNTETEEVMSDVLALNKVFQSAQKSKKVAPDSDVIKVIEQTTVDYVRALQKILPQITSNDNETQRQELVDSVHQTHNPFATFYM